MFETTAYLNGQLTKVTWRNHGGHIVPNADMFFVKYACIGKHWYDVALCAWDRSERRKHKIHLIEEAKINK